MLCISNGKKIFSTVVLNLITLHNTLYANDRARMTIYYRYIWTQVDPGGIRGKCHLQTQSAMPPSSMPQPEGWRGWQLFEIDSFHAVSIGQMLKKENIEGETSSLSPWWWSLSSRSKNLSNLLFSYIERKQHILLECLFRIAHKHIRKQNWKGFGIIRNIPPSPKTI